MDRLTAPVEWKAASHGELEGYASVFNNVDLDGDVVLPGAFRKTLADWSTAKAPMPLTADHELSTAGVIGSVASALEDTYGLKIRARFSSVPKAQDIRTKMVEGHLRGLSFIYEPLDHYQGQKGGQPVRFLRELRMYEATVSPAPRNLLALASAKAVSNTAWSQFSEADYTIEQWRAACLIDTGQGDPNSKARYSLPVKEPSGTLNRNGVHAAAGRLNQVQASAEKKATAARALMRMYGEMGEDPPEMVMRMAGKAGLSYEDLRTALTKAFEIPVIGAQKAAVDLIVASYHPEHTEDDAAGSADGQPTADAAAATGEPAAGTAQKSISPNAAAANYALSIISKTPEPPDGALGGEPPQALAGPLDVLDIERAGADQDRLEAEILAARGGAA